MRAQLSLERVKAEIGWQQRVFGDDAPGLVNKIGDAEGYVRAVIKDWEDCGTKIDVGEDAYFATRELKQAPSVSC